ncbi:hypothetical protein ACMFMF_008071 [Clarireedia jacksonii]
MPPTLHPSPSLLRSTLLRNSLLPITLSDGSTYLTRSTSPQPVFRSTKDTKNHPLWQPSLESLRNVESDEAGRLRAFRARFGRGWEADAGVAVEGKKEGDGKDEGGENLMDLISEGGAMGKEMMKGVVNTRSGKEKK